MELKIEKMIYGGDGLARMPLPESGRSKTIFLPFVLSGEEVSAAITEEKAGFSRAEAGRILQPSSERTAPRCPYFYCCGGCHYQHSTYENQLIIKRDILLETLRRMARLDWQGQLHVHPSAPWSYRNRTRLHVQSDPFAIGYFRHASRDLLPIEACPISSPLINRAIAHMWELGRRGKVPSSTREIEFFTTGEDDAMLVEAYSAHEAGASEQKLVEDFSHELKRSVPEITGTMLFATGSSLFHWDAATWSTGATALKYKTKYGSYQVQGGSFFQVNRYLVDELIDVAVTGESGEMALDLYAGTGLFSALLAGSFAKVVAVEVSPASFSDLQANVPSNVQAQRLMTEEFLRRFGRDLHADLVIVDPPRAGLEDKVTRSLTRMAPKRLTYVSCDPATLARDLRPLLDAGYTVREIHLLDLFPQTFHLEAVVKLEMR